MDIDCLLSLSAEEVLEYLVRNGCNFETVLKRLPVSKAMQLVHVISDVAALDRNVENVVRVLTTLNTDEFMDTIIHIVQCIDVRDNTEIDQFLDSVIQLVNRIFMRMPGAALKTLGLLQAVDRLAKHTILNLKEQDDDHLSLYYKKRDELEDLRKIIIDYMVQTQRAKVKRKVDTIKPPEDFREIPILPTTNDIFIPGHGKPFLRKNLKKGAYDDLDHYLDVQFRLFREDCISQLRSGIMEYIEQKHLSGNRDVGRLQDARLYKHAKLLNSEMTLEGRVHVVKLDPNHARKIRWESGKRLLYGSLLCLSFDNFQTLWFGVVTDSDTKKLKHSHTFKVKLSLEENQTSLPLGTYVTIVESSAYFEAYRHVLRCLQKIRPGDLAFQRYIIECKTDIRPPSYLLKEKENKYDFYPNIENKSIDKCLKTDTEKALGCKHKLSEKRMLQKENEDKYIFDITNDEWPSARDLHLNDSQYEAFKAALTQEFTLIQGPPGTGKTYLGLQIAKALIRNKNIWIEETEGNEKVFGRQLRRYINVQRHYPMLVVCYTNHALDQFVEGIVKFMNLDSTSPCGSVVRVGGRCSNEMSNFTLKSIRRRQRKFVNYWRYEADLKEKNKQVITLKYKLRDKRGVILSVRNLNAANPLTDIFKSDEQLHEWLGISEEACIDSLRHFLLRGNESDELYDRSSPAFNAKDNDETESSENELIEIETDAQNAIHDRRIDHEDFEHIKCEETDVSLNIGEFYKRIIQKHEKRLTEAAILQVKNIADEMQRKLSVGPMMSDSSAFNAHESLREGKHIKLEDRWKLYRYWVNKCTEKLKVKLNNAEREFEEVFVSFNKEKQLVDEEVLKTATVVAMTTSGAARYEGVLQEVAPKIIIVEEAAEVLEAHIIAALNPRCEHLILIGDHKQLEPKPSVYELAINYHLSLSMFERMIQNGLKFHSLHCQHRMRPEISQLVRPIYEKLDDNENVCLYPNIDGIRADVFFLKHKYPEVYKDEGRSYSNVFEAQYIERLCWYLIQQDYDPSQITVLTPYSGQMFCIRNHMPRSRFEGVRISILDNFQGEENDIILLSLVRSNSDGKMGFLDKENRVCVALSRARIGLFVIGNFDMIGESARKTTLWKEAIKCLSESPEEHIGHAIPLYCQNHPDTVIKARIPQDFDKAPDGGCERPCDFRLGCGHACRYSCHPKDRDHVEYKCKKPCPKTCERDHKCKKHCHHPDPCKCPVPVEKALLCGHVNKVECHMSPETLEKSLKKQSERTSICKYKCLKECERDHTCKKHCHFPDPCDCPVLVEQQLRCGHVATLRCYKDPLKHRCKVMVTKDLPNCEHSAEMPCYLDPEEYTCKVIVTRELQCGHVIDLECHIDTIRYKCQVTVTRGLKCGHTGRMKCFENERLFKCTEIVTSTRRYCNHTCAHECWDSDFDINNPCQILVDVKRLECNHFYQVECHNKSEDKQTMRRENSTLKWSKIEKKLGPCKELVVKEWPCHHPSTEIQCFTRKTASCKQICGQLCKRGHICERKCHHPETCKCKVEVEKILPSCGHTQKMYCYISRKSFECQFEVEKSLPHCEHTQVMKCHESADKVLCDIEVEKKLYCGHMKMMRCSDSVTKQTCFIRVMRHLACGHEKKTECSVPFPYTSVKCDELVRKNLVCGHEIMDKCNKDSSKVICKENVVTDNPRCNHKVKMPCHLAQKLQDKDRHKSVSFPNCQEKVEVTFDCGHSAQVPCYKRSSVVCLKTCKRRLSCGHQCKRKCFDCFDGDFHLACDQHCKDVLVCGYMCTESDCGTSSLCSLPCQYKCCHKTCDHPCLLPCEPCNKPCTWKCPHFECKKTCGEICDRQRCEARCFKRIPCNHFCIGYCGDPCPDLCRECDKETLAKLINKNIGEVQKLIFIQLQECKHIFESEALDHSVEEMSLNFQLLRCPECNVPITDYPRYRSILKKQQNRIQQMKLQLIFMAEKRSCQYFPLLSVGALVCEKYLKGFGTFLLLYQKQLRSTNDALFRRMEKLHDNTALALDKIKNRCKPDIQLYLDFYHVQKKICVFWQLGIIFGKISILYAEEDDGRNVKFSLKQLKKLYDKAIEIESFIVGPISYDDETLETVSTTVNEIVHIMPEMWSEIKAARNFSQMPFIFDAHLKFWSICEEGHCFCSVEQIKSCQYCLVPSFRADLRDVTQRLQDGKIRISKQMQKQGFTMKSKSRKGRILTSESERRIQRGTPKQKKLTASDDVDHFSNSIKGDVHHTYITKQGIHTHPETNTGRKQNSSRKRMASRQRSSRETNYNDNQTKRSGEYGEFQDIQYEDKESGYFTFRGNQARGRGRGSRRGRQNNRGRPGVPDSISDGADGDWFNNRQGPFLEPLVSNRGRNRGDNQRRGIGRGRGRRGRGFRQN